MLPYWKGSDVREGFFQEMMGATCSVRVGVVTDGVAKV